MNIVYFLTYDYSLKLWDESSAIDREVEYFNYLTTEYGLSFYIVSYGDTDDFKYEKLFLSAKIFPIHTYIKKSRFKVINLIKSFFYPFILKNHITLDSFVIKQNQLLGFWVSYLFKKIKSKKIFLRTGYDMFLFSKLADKSILKKFLYKLLTHFAINRSDLYSVSSLSDINFLQKNFNIQKSNIVLLRNWINSPKLIQIEKSNSFISVGRLEKQKNFEYLIDELIDTNFFIDIYGSGTQESKLKELINKKNSNIKMHNLIENFQLIKLFKETKYFISTSIYEGNPKALLEAMSCGCIVFASDIENNKEIIQDGENGFLFSLEKGELLKKLNQEIPKLEHNEKEINRIVENASNKINKEYSIENISKLEVSLIKEMLYGRKV